MEILGYRPLSLERIIFLEISMCLQLSTKNLRVIVHIMAVIDEFLHKHSALQRITHRISGGKCRTPASWREHVKTIKALSDGDREARREIERKSFAESSTFVRQLAPAAPPNPLAPSQHRRSLKADP